jgi:hypothetical protein
MDLFILDKFYRREQLVDDFESLVWAERYSSYGDFELRLPSTLRNRNRFVTGTNLAIPGSKRVMAVETFEDTTDDEGRKVLKLRGRSLERILQDRVARGTLGNLTDTPKWVLEGVPAAIARKIFHDICVAGILDPADVIPMVIEGTIFPDDTIPEPTEEISYEIDLVDVYKAIKDVCDLYDLGFRLVRNEDRAELYWDVYTGSDRTSTQSDLPAVIFSPNLDNLQNTSELTSVAIYKNVAYVFSPVGHEIVYHPDADPTTTGFERRVLIVKADDITDEDPPTASAKMIQRGIEELSRNRRFSAFDGEINQASKYQYGRDYNLGDLVEFQNSSGAINLMRVTEQIFVSDVEGDRAYPTLSLNTFITPGSWASWDDEEVWAEVDIDLHWADLPG